MTAAPGRGPGGSIRRADARDLSGLVRPGSVALTVTSPPYRNAIDYDAHASGRGGWYRGAGKATTGSWLDDMEEVFSQVFRATRPGGRCCIVVGDEVADGRVVPLPSMLLARLVSGEEDGGWVLRDSIIWNKVGGTGHGSRNRAGSFIQNPYPGYFRANLMHEHILVLQKGKGGRSRSGRIPLNRVVKREVANSVWNVAPVPPGTVSHPCPFPEQIPFRLVTLFSGKGDMVMDPMCGSGQVPRVARALGRGYLGFDVRKEYVSESRSRVGGVPSLSDVLIPVYHKESWSRDDQSGFFDTWEADLSANVPGGHALAFVTWPGAWGRPPPDLHAYYRGKSGGFCCFIITPSGRQFRVDLGRPGDRRSLLGRFLGAVPGGRFSDGDVPPPAESRHAGNVRVGRACIEALLHAGILERDGRGRGPGRYVLAGSGRAGSGIEAPLLK